MNYINRAFASVTRRFGKTMILLTIVFILGNVISGAISIQQATKQVEAATKEKMGSQASIDLDYKKFMEMMNSGESEMKIKPLSLDLIEKIGKNEHVKYYDYNQFLPIGSSQIKPYVGKSNIQVSQESAFSLKGVNYAPILDIEENKYKLLQGRVFTDEEIASGAYVALISKELAQENGLSVGDVITMKNYVFNPEDTSGAQTSESATNQDVVVEIIGLFEQVEYEQKPASGKGAFDPGEMMKEAAMNTLYVPNKMVEKEQAWNFSEVVKLQPDLAETESENSHIIPQFVLKSPESVKEFEAAINPLIPENYKLITSSDQYDQIAGPIKSIGSIAQIVLFVAIGASLLIISLIVILFLRDRKHEFGIYLSVGEKKSHVLGQVLIEVMVIAFIGISLSLFTGNKLAQGVSKTMIQNQLSKEDAGMNIFVSETQPDVTTEELVDSYEVSMNLTYIAIFYAVGLGTVIVSTAAPMVYLTRLNPKKILL